MVYFYTKILICVYSKFLGQVAFITGGWSNLKSVEVYSPNGDCQHSLASLPIHVEEHIMFRYGDTVLVCAGLQKNNAKYFMNCARN